MKGVFERSGYLMSVGIVKIKYTDFVRFESLQRFMKYNMKFFWTENARFRRIYPTQAKIILIN